MKSKEEIVPGSSSQIDSVSPDYRAGLGEEDTTTLIYQPCCIIEHHVSFGFLESLHPITPDSRIRLNVVGLNVVELLAHVHITQEVGSGSWSRSSLG